MSKFASGKNSYAISDRSGFRYRYRDMRKEWNGLLVGRDEFEPKQPQLGPFRKVTDPESLKNARPDAAETLDVFVGIALVEEPFPLPIVGRGLVGIVEVDIPDATPIAVLRGFSATASVGSVETLDSALVTGVSASTSVGSVTVTTPSAEITTYAVTVASYSGANYYYIDGSRAATLNLSEGSIYRFDQADSSNSNHPLRFSTTSDGTHGGGSTYTTGVTTNGTPGSAGAYTQIDVASGAPTLYYYCTNHSGMGGQVNT
jgi:hypothetical protein